MKPTVYWIPGPWRGRLAVVGRPRGGDWLRDETRGWRDAGIDTVVSLLEADEAETLGLTGEQTCVESSGLSFLSFPIPDRTAPASTVDAVAFLRGVREALEAGKNVAVHCRQGIGRSGLVAAGVLVLAGLRPEEALQKVSAARGEAVPETPAQLRWVRSLPAAELAVIR